MPDIIISDTSCFIVLSNVGQLDLLAKVYGNVITTNEVKQEFGDVLPDWVLVHAVKDKNRQQAFEKQLDKRNSPCA